MTVGSWSTMKTTYAPTSCRSSAPGSKMENGTTVSWNGADSAVLSAKRTTFKERVARFMKNPEILPNGRPKISVDVSRVSALANTSTIFDAARERRIKVYDEPLSGGEEYGAPHAYTKNWLTRMETTFIWDGTSVPQTGTVQACGITFDTNSLGNPFTLDHDYKLISRLRSKVVGSEFNLASFLGAEGRDTLRFLTETSTRIYRSALAARKLNFREAHKVLTRWGRAPHDRSKAGKLMSVQEDVYRDLIESAAAKNRKQGWWSVPASQWLEWHLAVAPLLGDVKAAAEQLAHVTEMPRSNRYQASVTAKVLVDPALIYTGAVWAGGRSVRKSIVAYFTYTPEPLAFLGLQDPEVTLWNAMPLTFVSDYFYNIGGFLEARATASALPVGLFVTTVKDEYNLTACLGRKSTGIWRTIVREQYQPYQRYRKGSLVRTISASLDVPKPVLKPLGAFKSWQRMATVASLFAVFTDSSARRPPLR